MSHGLCLLTHDLHPYGAQRLARSLTIHWTRDCARHVEVVACGAGELAADFRRHAPVTFLGQHWQYPARELAHVIPALHHSGVRVALTNTVIAARHAPLLRAEGIPCIALIHEMPTLIRENALETNLRAAHTDAAMVIYPHAAVAKAIRVAFPDLPNWSRARVMAQGLETVNPFRGDRAAVRRTVRQSLGIASDQSLVLGIGTGDRRKGIDLFLDAALAIERRVAADVAPCLLWIGPLNESDINEWQTRHGGQSWQSIQCFRWFGYQRDTMPFHAAADLFALSSREDPFPYVAMESLNAGVPVLAFEGSGGGADLAVQGGGRTVATRTGEALATAILEYLGEHAQRDRDGQQGAALIDSTYRFDRYAQELLRLADGLVSGAIAGV